MTYNKAEGDIIFYLDYNTQVITECKIKSKKSNGNYNLITAGGKIIKDAKVWLTYETREEAEKQAVPSYTI